MSEKEIDYNKKLGFIKKWGLKLRLDSTEIPKVFHFSDPLGCLYHNADNNKILKNICENKFLLCSPNLSIYQDMNYHIYRKIFENISDDDFKLRILDRLFIIEKDIAEGKGDFKTYIIELCDICIKIIDKSGDTWPKTTLARKFQDEPYNLKKWIDSVKNINMFKKCVRKKFMDIKRYIDGDSFIDVKDTRFDKLQFYFTMDDDMRNKYIKKEEFNIKDIIILLRSLYPRDKDDIQWYLENYIFNSLTIADDTKKHILSLINERIRKSKDNSLLDFNLSSKESHLKGRKLRYKTKSKKKIKISKKRNIYGFY